MACAADTVGAAMAKGQINEICQRTRDGQDYIIYSFSARRSLSLAPSSSCGEQVRIYDIHYATPVEGEDPFKFWEGTFLTE